jgi:RNA polymerase sigma factor (sigma-70 family)
MHMVNLNLNLRPVGERPSADTAGPATDAEVIAQSLADPERFASIFDRHADEIYRYATRRVEAQAAADVVSDVFLVAFRKRGGYSQDRADARPWLYGITTEVISQHLRRRARLLAAVPAPPAAELFVDELSDRIAAQRLRPVMLSVLAGLSPADRDLVLLVAWAELSYEQAAEALGIPVGTVRSRLHRIRAKVRRSIGLAAVGDIEENVLIPKQSYALMYRAAATVKGISLVPHVTDIAGRTGIGVSACIPAEIQKGSMRGFHGCPDREELVFDAKTYELVGTATDPAPGHARLPGSPDLALLQIAIVSRSGLPR